jgi:hypothetical protein
MKTTARKNECFDDDSFWRELYSVVFSREANGRCARANREGTGPHRARQASPPSTFAAVRANAALHLQEKDFSVTEVDRTKNSLQKFFSPQIPALCRTIPCWPSGPQVHFEPVLRRLLETVALAGQLEFRQVGQVSGSRARRYQPCDGLA